MSQDEKGAAKPLIEILKSEQDTLKSYLLGQSINWLRAVMTLNPGLTDISEIVKKFQNDDYFKAGTESLLNAEKIKGDDTKSLKVVEDEIFAKLDKKYSKTTGKEYAKPSDYEKEKELLIDQINQFREEFEGQLQDPERLKILVQQAALAWPVQSVISNLEKDTQNPTVISSTQKRMDKIRAVVELMKIPKNVNIFDNQSISQFVGPYFDSAKELNKNMNIEDLASKIKEGIEKFGEVTKDFIPELSRKSGKKISQQAEKKIKEKIFPQLGRYMGAGVELSDIVDLLNEKKSVFKMQSFDPSTAKKFKKHMHSREFSIAGDRIQQVIDKLDYKLQFNSYQKQEIFNKIYEGLETKTHKQLKEKSKARLFNKYRGVVFQAGEENLGPQVANEIVKIVLEANKKQSRNAYEKIRRASRGTIELPAELPRLDYEEFKSRSTTISTPTFKTGPSNIESMPNVEEIGRVFEGNNYDLVIDHQAKQNINKAFRPLFAEAEKAGFTKEDSLKLMADSVGRVRENYFLNEVSDGLLQDAVEAFNKGLESHKAQLQSPDFDDENITYGFGDKFDDFPKTQKENSISPVKNADEYMEIGGIADPVIPPPPEFADKGPQTPKPEKVPPQVAPKPQRRDSGVGEEPLGLANAPSESSKESKTQWQDKFGGEKSSLEALLQAEIARRKARQGEKLSFVDMERQRKEGKVTQGKSTPQN